MSVSHETNIKLGPTLFCDGYKPTYLDGLETNVSPREIHRIHAGLNAMEYYGRQRRLRNK